MDGFSDTAERPPFRAATRWAIYYLSLGWSVFPVKVFWNPRKHDGKGGWEKHPFVKWTPYQRESVSEEQAIQWFEKEFPYALIGVATGAVSGIVVLDCDQGSDPSSFPETVRSRTISGGQHLMYQHPGGQVTGSPRLLPFVDLRADGNFIVVPSGDDRYKWVAPPHATPLAPYPADLITKLSSQKKINLRETIEQELHIPEGERNAHYSRFVWKLLHKLEPYLWETVVLPAALEFNRRYSTPPEEEKQVLATFKSAAEAVRRKRAKARGRKSQSDLILDSIERDPTIVLFHTDLQEPYVSLPVGEHREIWSLKSRMLRRWLARSFWETEGKAPHSESILTALNVLEGKAYFEGKESRLHNRVAWVDQALWYDLTDRHWRAVEITPEGWRVVDDPPILFRRYSHQHPQVEPVRNGDARLLLKFVNIHDEGQQLLLLVWVISCFIPDFPHPILNVYGPQGAAKSLLCKILRKVIDPSAIEVAGFPRESQELIQLLAHHWSIFFDNVSQLPWWVSDILCKAVSGDGFSKRELFSDDEDVIYIFKRCVALNGINLVASKADLLERSILLELDRMPEGKRRQEEELLREFEQARPQIVGGILNAVSMAMRLKLAMQRILTQLPRMADFCVWGSAIAEAVGYPRAAFLQAYYRNIKQQNEEVLNESLVATTVRAFMEERQEWQETPSGLLETLTQAAKELSINTDKERGWPKAASVLGKHLNELKPTLASEGIQVERYERNKQRLISLRKGPENAVSAVEPPDAAYLSPFSGDGPADGRAQ
ncbi:MAG: bifunctional DNA primase/polymerase [Candidatus Methylomirabilales bacterium]